MFASEFQRSRLILGKSTSAMLVPKVTNITMALPQQSSAFLPVMQPPAAWCSVVSITKNSNHTAHHCDHFWEALTTATQKPRLKVEKFHWCLWSQLLHGGAANVVSGVT